MQTSLRQVLKGKSNVVYSVGPDATVTEAVRTMNANKIGSVLVTDRGWPVGVFSERDVLTRVVDAGRDPTITNIREVMSEPVITVSTDVTVGEALSIINQKRCRHLPVTEGGDIVGMISSGDLTSWIIRDQAVEIGDLVDYIGRRYPR